MRGGGAVKGPNLERPPRTDDAEESSSRPDERDARETAKQAAKLAAAAGVAVGAAVGAASALAGRDGQNDGESRPRAQETQAPEREEPDHEEPDHEEPDAVGASVEEQRQPESHPLQPGPEEEHPQSAGQGARDGAGADADDDSPQVDDGASGSLPALPWGSPFRSRGRRAEDDQERRRVRGRRARRITVRADRATQGRLVGQGLVRRPERPGEPWWLDDATA